MRAVLVFGLLVLWPVMAAAQSETRYFTSIDGLMDGNADVILKEARAGRAVTAAVLDVCYPATPGASRKDRFVVNLAASGQSLSGSAATLNDKLPVSVKLIRKAVDGRYDFSGEVRVGETTTEVRSTDNADMSEAEFSETRDADSEIAVAPQAFTEVSPEALAVRVRLDAMIAFVSALRGQDVEIDFAGLVTSCEELRAGEQTLTMEVDPARAGEFLARFRASPGVVAAGWTVGRFDLERTLRFAAAGWGSGKPDRARIAATVAETLKAALDASSATTVWDEALGRLVVTLKRPATTIAGLGLTETLRTTVIVAPDRPAGGDHWLLWLDRFVATTADETAGSALRLAASPGFDEGGGAGIDDGGVFEALAGAFKAQRWDLERQTWK